MMPASRAAGLAARIAAQDSLHEVLHRRRPLDKAEAAGLGEHSLPPSDAGFARAIVHETFRRFGQLDALIRQFVPKPPAPHRAGPVLEILLAAACELLFLAVAPHAAVDMANRLCVRDAKAKHFKPLVNAVMRRVAREGATVLAAQDAPRLNTPDWLWARWAGAYGEDTARAIASAHMAQPPLDLMFQREDTARDIPEARHLLGNVYRLPRSARVDALPHYADGAWWVQDVAATLPARLLGDVRGKNVIDLCAAPGGKTAQLAAAGARVTAVERDAERISRMHENLARLKLDAEFVEADMLDWQPQAPVPFVLLDAPCSATGTIRRHPELPWIKGASDVTLCAAAAQEMLNAAAEMVAKKGVLVFAVCSLGPEEGEEQIAAFLARHDDFARERIAPEEVFGHAQWLTRDGDLRTLPSHLAEQGGMDGFYAARLRRL